MRVAVAAFALALTIPLSGCIGNPEDQALIEQYNFSAKHARLMRTCKRQMTEHKASFDDGKTLAAGCACVTDGVRSHTDRKFDNFADTTLKILFMKKPSMMLLTEIALQAKWMEDNEIPARESQVVLKAMVGSFAFCGYDIDKARRSTS